MVIALGLLYAAFIIPQILTVDNRDAIDRIFVARIFILAAFAAFALIITITKRAVVYKAVLTAFEFAFPASYFYIVFYSNQFNFLIKCLDVILIITFIFIMPNDWINACSAALFMIISFFIFSLIVQPGLDDNQFFAGVTYISLLFLTGCFASFVVNISERRQYLSRMLLKQLVETDYLTGVNSRVKFDEVCRQLLAVSNQDNTPMCMAVFDIDDFKIINDTHGHIVGDKVLISLSLLVSQNLKGEEFFARWGGEEFVLIFPSSNLEQAVDRINDLREKINAFVFTDGIYLSCSFGVVSALGIDDIDTFFGKADRLMYLAKLAGKDIVVYDKTLI